MFRGRARPGQSEAFERYIRTRGIPEFESNPGVVSVHFGTPTDQTPDEFLVVTVWRDLESLKAYAGERWGDPKLSLEEAHMLEQATVHHYRNGNGEGIGSASLAGSGPRADVVEAGPVRVDLTARAAEVEGQRVELPPREFSVLVELAVRPGSPITSEELAKLAWPDTAFATGEDVRRVVYRLRRMIGDHERDRTLIRNRRGYGYVLEP